ncbi:excisionase family DNA binding protein [Curtobacterium flaccumfaciens]|uniref:Excisionase family DNA binding protein n=1 Tax=Curtobacterium flaccumfaciens TaxID=2035 RepID=A0A4R6DDB0_9MICO|nr:helix-turn-helix domain-containing protein [Curtobacterium flaccumfaciens]TDN42555.1 excisionase family DNA binding protein [Curtobacterium flaccumfaciens]
MHRPPEHLVLGGRGPEAVVTGRVAAYLLRHAGLDDYRRRHRGEDPEVDNTLVALTLVALTWRSSATGTRQAATPELDHTADWMSTRQAAEALGLSDRGIRKAIQERRLHAVRVGRAWRVDREQLAQYTERTDKT